MASPSDELESKTRQNRNMTHRWPDKRDLAANSPPCARESWKAELKLDSRLEGIPTLRCTLGSHPRLQNCKLVFSFTFVLVLLCLTSQAHTRGVLPAKPSQ